MSAEVQELKSLQDWGLSALVRLAEIAYSPTLTAVMEAEDMGFCARPVVNYEAFALVCEAEDQVVVAVRGTQPRDLRDVIADGRCCPVRDRQRGYVHRGFVAHADLLFLSLLQSGVMATKKQLVFVGHSLGGAAATYLASWFGAIRSGTLSRPHLVTFGAPRVGTGGFVRNVRSTTASITRVVNHRDPVPVVMWSLYRHPAGRLLHFDDDGLASVNPSLGHRLKCRRGTYRKAARTALGCGPCEAMRQLRPIRNHYISAYRRLIDALDERVSVVG